MHPPPSPSVSELSQLQGKEGKVHCPGREVWQLTCQSSCLSLKAFVQTCLSRRASSSMQALSLSSGGTELWCVSSSSMGSAGTVAAGSESKVSRLATGVNASESPCRLRNK